MNMRPDLSEYEFQGSFGVLQQSSRYLQLCMIDVGRHSDSEVTRYVRAGDSTRRERKCILAVSKNREYVASVVASHTLKPTVWVGFKQSPRVFQVPQGLVW